MSNKKNYLVFQNGQMIFCGDKQEVMNHFGIGLKLLKDRVDSGMPYQSIFTFRKEKYGLTKRMDWKIVFDYKTELKRIKQYADLPPYYKTFTSDTEFVDFYEEMLGDDYLFQRKRKGDCIYWEITNVKLARCI